MARRLSQAAIMYHKDTLNWQLHIHGKVWTKALIKYEQTLRSSCARHSSFSLVSLTKQNLVCPTQEHQRNVLFLCYNLVKVLELHCINSICCTIEWASDGIETIKGYYRVRIQVQDQLISLAPWYKSLYISTWNKWIMGHYVSAAYFHHTSIQKISNYLLQWDFVYSPSCYIYIGTESMYLQKHQE